MLVFLFAAPLNDDPLVGSRECFTRRAYYGIDCAIMLKLRNYIKFSILFIVILLGSWSIYIKVKLNAYDIEVKTKTVEIKNSYGVEIHYKYTPESFFPNDRSAHGSQAWLKHIKTTLPLVEEFLSRYPTEVIKKNLSDLFLVGKLEFSGKRYGGTSIESAVYIATGGFFRSSESFLLGLMHAEFSSILLRNYEFPKEAWKAANRPGWTYEDSDRGTGFKMLGQKNLHQQTEELLQTGFLEKFSQSDLENDFNTFVVWSFTKPDRLRELASKYDRIRKKYQLVIQFYDSIDPRIDIPRLQMTPKNTTG